MELKKGSYARRLYSKEEVKLVNSEDASFIAEKNNTTIVNSRNSEFIKLSD